MTVYIINSVAWAVLGLLAGYVLGRGARAAAIIEEAAAPMTDPDLDPPPSRRPWWRWHPDPGATDRIVGVAVVALAIISVIVMAVTLTGQQNRIEATEQAARCQTTLNQSFTDALTERADAAAQERAAQRDLLVATQQRSGPELDAAIQRYLAQLADADKQRAANPYPTGPPSCT